MTSRYFKLILPFFCLLICVLPFFIKNDTVTARAATEYDSDIEYKLSQLPKNDGDFYYVLNNKTMDYWRIPKQYDTFYLATQGYKFPDIGDSEVKHGPYCNTCKPIAPYTNAYADNSTAYLLYDNIGIKLFDTLTNVKELGGGVFDNEYVKYTGLQYNVNGSLTKYIYIILQSVKAEITLNYLKNDGTGFLETKYQLFGTVFKDFPDATVGEYADFLGWYIDNEKIDASGVALNKLYTTIAAKYKYHYITLSFIHGFKFNLKTEKSLKITQLRDTDNTLLDLEKKYFGSAECFNHYSAFGQQSSLYHCVKFWTLKKGDKNTAVDFETYKFNPNEVLQLYAFYENCEEANADNSNLKPGGDIQGGDVFWQKVASILTAIFWVIVVVAAIVLFFKFIFPKIKKWWIEFALPKIKDWWNTPKGGKKK